MHLKRLVVALVLVPLLYMYVMYLPAEYYLVLLTVVSTLGLAEFYAICRVSFPVRVAGLGWGGALLLTAFARPGLLFPALLLAAMSVAAVRLFERKDPGGGTAEVSSAVYGLVYLPCLLSVQFDIVKNNPAWLVMLFFGVWGADSMAYYVGKSIGKRKLSPIISPNKTVEGAVGSVIGGAVGTLIVKFTLLSAVSFSHAILLGLIIGVVTIVGDLVESLFKRDAGVKDSGSIMPGHGGMLDKLDSVAYAGPVFYWSSVALGLMR